MWSAIVSCSGGDILVLFSFQFLNVPMFRNVTMKCLTEIGKRKTLSLLLLLSLCLCLSISPIPPPLPHSFTSLFSFAVLWKTPLRTSDFKSLQLYQLCVGSGMILITPLGAFLKGYYSWLHIHACINMVDCYFFILDFRGHYKSNVIDVKLCVMVVLTEVFTCAYHFLFCC